MTLKNRHLKAHRQTIIFGVMIILSFFVSISFVSAGFGFGQYVPQTVIKNIYNSTNYYNSSLLATDLNVNSSNFWDNLDTPNDIAESIYWYNHTVDSNQFCIDYTLANYIPLGENTTIWAAINSFANATAGINGTDGRNGTDGTNGTNGVDGTNGTNGVDGLNGTNGTNGIDGVDGSNGSNGIDGVNGINGTDGTNGTNGTNGIDGINGTFIDILNATQFFNETLGWNLNMTWLKEYTDTLYASILWNYNQTSPAITYVQNNYYNQTASDLRYSNISTTYTPYEVTVVSGTLDAGNITSIQYILDGDTLNISEVMVGGFEVIANYSGVTSIDNIIMREYYSGVLGHEISINLWNYNTNAWDEFSEITNQNGFVVGVYPIIGGSINYVSGGEAMVRLKHIQAGTITHRFYLDYLIVQKGTATTTTSDHDALSNRDNICSNHPQICNGFLNNFITLDYTNLTGTVPAAWLSTYNATYASIVPDNSTWNQTLATTLYAPIAITGTVTSVTCGAGLSGGAITSTGTCAVVNSGSTYALNNLTSGTMQTTLAMGNQNTTRNNNTYTYYGDGNQASIYYNGSMLIIRVN
jgi:hypothetical protein